jgi:glucose-6-phosphate isomerase
MLSLDISGALAKAITPSKGIPEQEFVTLRTRMKRHVESWLREREGGGHAWSMDPYDKRVLKQVENIAAFAKAEKVRTVVWIGIGGSSLGPQVIQECLEGPDTMEFMLLDTIDPAMIKMSMEVIDWKHSMLVVASKSGTTLEPMSLFFLCYEQMKKARGEQACKFTIAITDPHTGPLRAIALEENIEILPIPPLVGGRFSIFTPIGLLPVALLGGNVTSFLKGAKEMDTLCQNTVLEENPAALLAATQFLLETKRECPVRVIMPYSQRLASLARWNQQLVAESLGKNELNNPIPLASIGTQDQHSLLQQWMEGVQRCWHIFIREQEKTRVTVPLQVAADFKYIAGKTYGQLMDACYEGTSRALTGAKRPHATITLQRLNEDHLGQLFFLFMAEVVFLGKLYRIDPYGQPGVEAGKTITRELLENMPTAEF